MKPAPQLILGICGGDTRSGGVGERCACLGVVSRLLCTQYQSPGGERVRNIRGGGWSSCTQDEDTLEFLLLRRDVERQEASAKFRRNAVQGNLLHSISATRKPISQSPVTCLGACFYGI